MTVINPNSISGVASVTAQGDIIQFYKSDGTLGAVQFDGANFNTTSGISTFKNLYVGGTLTYEDVKNVDAIGIITARSAVSIADSIVHTGDTNTAIRFPEADNFTVECAGAERFRVKPTNDVAVFTGSNSGTLTIRNDTSNEMQIHSGSSDALILGSGGENERLRITSGGSVNIGGNFTQTTYKASITTGNVNKKISFNAAAHNDLSNEGSGIFFSRQNDGSAELSGLFSHSNGGFGIATREDMTFHTGGGSTYGSAIERLRIHSNGKISTGVINNSYELTIGGLSGGPTLWLRDSGTSGAPRILFGSTVGALIGAISYNNSSNHMEFATNSTERLRIDSSGKVGMGLEDGGGTGCDPDGNALLIRSASTFQTNKGHIMLTGDSATVGQGPQIVFSESGSGSNNAGAYIGHVRQGSNSVGDLVFGTRAVTGDASTVPEERLRITSSGALLVGLISATYGSGDMQHEIKKNNSRTYTAPLMTGHSHLLLNNSDTTDNVFCGLGIRAGSGDGSIGYVYRGSANNADFVVNTDGNANGVERFRIFNNGSVLIGSLANEAAGGATSGGSARLVIDCEGLNVFDGVGAASNYGLVFANDPTTNKANGIGFFNDSGAAAGGYIVHQDKGGNNIGDLVFGTASTADSPTEKLRITSDGKVGINDSNPSNLLVVKAPGGSGHATAKIVSGDASTIMVMQAIQGSEGRLGIESNHALALYAGTVERIRIDSTGEVSIKRGGISAVPIFQLFGSGNAGDAVADNLRFHNWGDANGDYWQLGSNLGLDVNGNNAKPSTTLKGAAINIDGRGGRIFFKVSQSSTSTVKEALIVENNGQITITGNSGKMIDCRTSATTGNCWISLSKSNGTNKGYFGYGSSSNEQLYIVQQENADITIYNGSASRWYFKTDGQLNSATDGAINVFGGADNHPNDAIIYCDKTSSADWCISANAQTTDYGIYTRVGQYAAYGIGVYDHSNSAWRFRVNGAGTIYATATTIASISDQRLKENIVDANSQWDDIKALRFRNFKWKANSGYADGKTYLGLISQEVETISPGLVEINAQTKEDIENEVPDPEYKNVKYSIVWMKAMKALQEAQARIETLEAKVATLEGS